LIRGRLQQPWSRRSRRAPTRRLE